MPSAYSQGTPTCEELEEENKNDKFYCRESKRRWRYQIRSCLWRR